MTNNKDRWEYCQAKGLFLMDSIKKLGEEGWELVSVVEDNTYLVAFLKRKIEEN